MDGCADKYSVRCGWVSWLFSCAVATLRALPSPRLTFDIYVCQLNEAQPSKAWWSSILPICYSGRCHLEVLSRTLLRKSYSRSQHLVMNYNILSCCIDAPCSSWSLTWRGISLLEVIQNSFVFLIFIRGIKRVGKGNWGQ